MKIKKIKNNMELEKLNIDFKRATKIDLREIAETHAQNIIEEGITPVDQAFISIKKIKDYCDFFYESIKKDLADKLDKNNGILSLGSEVITKTGSGQTLNYEDDEEYFRLKLLLDNRKKLIDSASKSRHIVVDENGVVVNKVSVKTIKADRITLKY